jgi:acyl phosphate:glycerol-3-phosphate acyltransferase
LTFAAIVVFGYLLGSCPWGYWLVRIFRHEDVRGKGSGNIGATNVWRVYGRWFGLPVVLLDTLKGAVPALVGVLAVSHLCGILAGAAAMLGHARPLYLRFEKGGKLVATGGGVLFAVGPWAALTLAGLWLVMFAISRYASLSSIVTAFAMPLAAALFGYPLSVIVFAGLTGAAIVFLHRANLRRLRAGTETKFRPRRTAGVA